MRNIIPFIFLELDKTVDDTAASSVGAPTPSAVEEVLACQFSNWPLELSLSEEICILDNREIFEQNGFRFEYSEDKPLRHHFALTSLPHSGARDGRNAVQFGKDDVCALCAVLGADGHSYSQDGGTGVDGNGMYGNNAVRRYAGLSQDGENVMTRLPGCRHICQSCLRGSIMIGTALSKKEIEKIVHRLANVEHPWNCPHG